MIFTLDEDSGVSLEEDSSFSLELDSSLAEELETARLELDFSSSALLELSFLFELEDLSSALMLLDELSSSETLEELSSKQSPSSQVMPETLSPSLPHALNSSANPVAKMRGSIF